MKRFKSTPKSRVRSLAEYGLLGLLGASLALCIASCDPKQKEEEEASAPRVYAECNLTGEPQEAELDVGATGFKSIHWVRPGSHRSR